MGICWSTRVKAESPSNTHTSARSPRTEDEILQAPNLKNFGYNELKGATRDFRPDSLLGEGGFGCVFKGWVDAHSLTATKPGSGIVIAVKKLNQEGFQGHREWLAEVNYLGQLSHPNLVKLIGYCVEEEHRMLVYEFMSRGSLENHLFRSKSLPVILSLVFSLFLIEDWHPLKRRLWFYEGHSNFQHLSWGVRLKIAIGAAKGLAYLHKNEIKVIYRDFKAANILLDSDFNAKLSDFGLARDGPAESETHVSTRVMGTYGYAAPEYLATGHLTSKSDVYSFGVVLLELLSGRRAIDKKRMAGEENLVQWARPYMQERRKLYRIMDPRLEGQYPLKVAYATALLALRCLNNDPRSRPTMDEVLERLQKFDNGL